MPLFMAVHHHVGAPDAEAASAVHREALGLVADGVISVTEGS